MSNTSIAPNPGIIITFTTTTETIATLRIATLSFNASIAIAKILEQEIGGLETVMVEIKNEKAE